MKETPFKNAALLGAILLLLVAYIVVQPGCGCTMTSKYCPDLTLIIEVHSSPQQLFQPGRYVLHLESKRHTAGLIQTVESETDVIHFDSDRDFSEFGDEQPEIVDWELELEGEVVGHGHDAAVVWEDLVCNHATGLAPGCDDDMYTLGEFIFEI